MIRLFTVCIITHVSFESWHCQAYGEETMPPFDQIIQAVLCLNQELLHAMVMVSNKLKFKK